MEDITSLVSLSDVAGFNSGSPGTSGVGELVERKIGRQSASDSLGRHEAASVHIAARDDWGSADSCVRLSVPAWKWH